MTTGRWRAMRVSRTLSPVSGPPNRALGLIRPWQVYLALGLAPIAVYYALGDLPQSVLYDGLSLAAGLAVLVGVRLHRPRPRLPWLLLAAGQLCWFAGDAAWDVLSRWFHLQPFPSLADGFYLAGYPLIALGLSMLVGKRQDRPDWRVLCDAAILAIGSALVVWVMLVDPLVTDPTLGPVERAVSVAYPIGDIMLLGVLARIVVLPGGLTAALRLFALSLVASLVGDVLFALLALDHGTTSFVDGVFLAGYALWGSAALHPSIAASPQAIPDVDPRLSPARLVALALACLVAPAVLVVEGAAGGGIDSSAIALGGALTVVLVLARIDDLVRELARALQERRALEDLLRHQAFHDALTGLPNRALLADRLAHALSRREGRIALLYLDVDDFKTVNDTLGHAAGDGVLVAIAERLRACVRAADTAARMGGDEYAVLLEDVGAAAEPIRVAERLIGAFRTPFVADGVERPIRVSIGIALAQASHDRPEDVLRRADLAMYRAKSAGGARFELYKPAMQQELLRRVALQTQLA